jgi:glutathione S-transferase
MTPHHLTLHHYPASRSARAKWMLHEVVGNNFEVSRVALYDGAQYSDEFLRLNPNHVPVLEITWDNGIRRGARGLPGRRPPRRRPGPPPGPPERADYLQRFTGPPDGT